LALGGNLLSKDENNAPTKTHTRTCDDQNR
jgi:hypothetical protein